MLSYVSQIQLFDSKDRTKIHNRSKKRTSDWVMETEKSRCQLRLATEK
jgi:hypothetical protein